MRTYLCISCTAGIAFPIFFLRPVEVLIVDCFKQLLALDTVDGAQAPPFPPSTSLPENFLELTLGQLGGDSLAAMRLSGLLKEYFHVEITADFILQRQLSKVVELVGGGQIEGGIAGGQPLGVTESPHDGEEICWDKEISLDDLGLEALHQGKREQRDTTVQSATVLLTGATGFLGRFILLELLQNQSCGKVCCIVKEKDG